MPRSIEDACFFIVFCLLSFGYVYAEVLKATGRL
jgi:hypothetical protein